MTDFKYDVFLSCNLHDKQTISELVDRLELDNLKVWLDEWEHQPEGVNEEIDEALKHSRAFILAMSTHTFAVDWLTVERRTQLFRDPVNVERRFIPLRLDDSEVMEGLKPYHYLDWRDRSEQQYQLLLISCGHGITAEMPDEENAWQQPDTLKGSGSIMWAVAVTATGRRAVSGSGDALVRVWDLDNGECVATLRGHTARVLSVAISANGRRAISGSGDGTVLVWDLETGSCLAKLRAGIGEVRSVAMTIDGTRALSCSNDDFARVWDLIKNDRVGSLKAGGSSVFAAALSANGRVAATSQKAGICVWESSARGRYFGPSSSQEFPIRTVAMTASGDKIISGSDDTTIRVWDVETGRCLGILEGHTGAISKVTITPDGRWAASCSKADKTVRLWDIPTGTCQATFTVEQDALTDVAITSDGRRVICAAWSGDLLIWDLPAAADVSIRRAEATRYTNAKVLLVGESGVGKSGLAIRLTQDRFEPTISSDAAWATQLKLPHELSTNDIEREIWLWDFAGQADYRLIHQLYMDETALAVLVFNPQSENPFDTLGEWDRDLQKASRGPFKKLLIAGRCDRGGLMVSRDSVELFRREREFEDYLETSAYTGYGCEELRTAIIKNIPWPEVTWIASPRIFKLLKDEIVKLRDEGQVLLRIRELRQQLEMRLPRESFKLEQLRAVLGLLASPGIIWQLEFGDFILLQPEHINAYAAAVIRSVRAHTEEIGFIPEERVMAGDLDYQDRKRLPPHEEQIVLRAMHQTFVNHGLCLREHTDKGPLLIFPSYFKRERPELEGHPFVIVTYKFNGALDEIYATLIVSSTLYGRL